MKRENLTETRINKYKCPLGKQQVFFGDEGNRLAVRVTASGNRSYIYEGYLRKKTIRLTIGNVSDWNLDDARKEARRLQTLIDQDIDPRQIKLKEKQEKAQAAATVEAAKKYTLKELLRTYITHLKTQGKVKSANGMESTIKCHLLETDKLLANKPAAEVTSIELAGLIREVKEKGYDRTAGILRATLAAAYNCARRSPFDASLPSEFISFQISSNPVEPIPAIAVNAGQRVLSEDELKIFISALGDEPIDLAIKVALFAGGQRMAQLLRAEVIHWDHQNRTLLLYDGKGKRRNAREHLLPLQGTAAGIVSGIMERRPEKWIFSNDGGKTPIHEANTGKRISAIVADKKMADFNYRDIRRTCETMLAGLGISKDTRSQLLSHGISGIQAVHYDRHDYLKEKKSALVKWERHLHEVVTGKSAGKVINFA